MKAKTSPIRLHKKGKFSLLIALLSVTVVQAQSTIEKPVSPPKLTKKELQKEFLFQYGPPEDNVDPGFDQMCHSCLMLKNQSAFLPGRNADGEFRRPRATFTKQDSRLDLNEDFAMNQCLRKDPRLNTGIRFNSPIADGIFQCNKMCSQNVRGNKKPTIREMEMGQEEMMFGDRHCTFKMNFWDVRQSESVSGVRIKFENRYAKENLRFYTSDKPIQVGQLMPSLEELEKYRFDPKRQGLRQGTNLFVINMGMEVGTFRLTGTPRDATHLISDVGPQNIEEIKLEEAKYEVEYAKNGPPIGQIVLMLFIILLVVAIIGAAVFFLLKRHKSEQQVQAMARLEEDQSKQNVNGESRTVEPRPSDKGPGDKSQASADFQDTRNASMGQSSALLNKSKDGVNSEQKNLVDAKSLSPDGDFEGGSDINGTEGPGEPVIQRTNSNDPRQTNYDLESPHRKNNN